MMRTNAENFVKIVQTSRPWGASSSQKLEILTVLEAVLPHFCLDKREIWRGKFGAGKRTCGPHPWAKFHVYWGHCDPILGFLNKDNTGMAALRAGLPAMTESFELFVHLTSKFNVEKRPISERLCSMLVPLVCVIFSCVKIFNSVKCLIAINS